MTEARNARVDRISILGAIIGVFALAAPLLVQKANRLASGTPHYLWNSNSVFALLFFGFLYFIVFVLTMQRGPAKMFKQKPRVILVGLIGNIVLVASFFFAGSEARRLAAAAAPYARFSLGAGVWLLSLSGYMLIVSAQKSVKAGSGMNLFLSLSGLALFIFLFGTGAFKDLSIMQEYAARKERFFQEVLQHLRLTNIAVAIALLLGMPLGVWTYRNQRLEKPIFAIINTIQTIPGLALFGLLIAPLSLLSLRYPFLRTLGISGIGAAPAIIALSLYALLPITYNTHIGLKTVDAAVREAGRGMGMSRREIFFSIEVPLSVPVIFNGVRTSVVQAVGNTAIAALIGAGGLGTFIFQGLGQAAPDLILLGALPIIALAVIADRSMFVLTALITPKGLKV